jgi:hypothetical protein
VIFFARVALLSGDLESRAILEAPYLHLFHGTRRSTIQAYIGVRCATLPLAARAGFKTVVLLHQVRFQVAKFDILSGDENRSNTNGYCGYRYI